jgi:hypothetical protein
MLVGVGGSGKASLARFGAFLADTEVFTLELSRGYGPAEFREDLKKLYRCGRRATVYCCAVVMPYRCTAARNFVQAAALRSPGAAAVSPCRPSPPPSGPTSPTHSYPPTHSRASLLSGWRAWRAAPWPSCFPSSTSCPRPSWRMCPTCCPGGDLAHGSRLPGRVHVGLCI